MRTPTLNVISLLALALPTLGFSQSFEKKAGDQIQAQQNEVKTQVAAMKASQSQTQPDDVILVPSGPFSSDPARYKAIVRELSLKTADCRVDFGSMLVSLSINGPGLFEYADQAMRDYADLERKLKDYGIALRFTYHPEIAVQCSLSRDSERFNFGSVEALRYIQSAVEHRFVEKGKAHSIDELIIEIGPKTGEDLYRTNLQAKPEMVDGKLVLKTKVNAGNESVGLAVIELSMKMFNNR